MASVSDVTKMGFRVITFDTVVSSGFSPSATTLVATSWIKKRHRKTVNDTETFRAKKNKNARTLSVRIPESRALESVSKTASMRRAAMRLQASETVVPSGMVSAFDNRSFLTVLSPPSSLTEEKIIIKNEKLGLREREREKKKVVTEGWFRYGRGGRGISCDCVWSSCCWRKLEWCSFFWMWMLIRFGA